MLSLSFLVFAAQVVDAVHLESFRRKAAAQIPAALDDLSEEPSNLRRECVYGLLAGYVVCSTGHRKGVLQNMMLSEVTGAPTESGRQYVIKVRLIITTTLIFTGEKLCGGSAQCVSVLPPGVKAQNFFHLWARHDSAHS